MHVPLPPLPPPAPSGTILGEPLLATIVAEAVATTTSATTTTGVIGEGVEFHTAPHVLAQILDLATKEEVRRRLQLLHLRSSILVLVHGVDVHTPKQ